MAKENDKPVGPSNVPVGPGVRVPSWIIPTLVTLSVVAIVFLVRGAASDEAKVLDAANLITINKHIDRNEEIDDKAAMDIKELQMQYANLEDDVADIKTTSGENQKVLFKIAAKMDIEI